VIVRSVGGLYALTDLSGRRQFYAEDGRPGSGANRRGRSGRPLTISVPVGTLVRDRDSGLVLSDLTAPGKSVVVARGGKGGKGNRYFATATNQTPRIAEDGMPGEERWIELDLKIIADIGLIGLPNAGKSTLLSRLSSARPRVADYPFTTLAPHVGVVETSDYRRIVMADIPGLIEGAHQGHGLGHDFLRHIERTRVLVHLVDLMPVSGPDPIRAYRIVRTELERYNPKLTQKPEIIAANKIDLPGAKKNLAELERFLRARVHSISALTGEGVGAMLHDVLRELDSLRPPGDPAPQ